MCSILLALRTPVGLAFLDNCQTEFRAENDRDNISPIKDHSWHSDLSPLQISVWPRLFVFLLFKSGYPRHGSSWTAIKYRTLDCLGHSSFLNTISNWWSVGSQAAPCLSSGRTPLRGFSDSTRGCDLNTLHIRLETRTHPAAAPLNTFLLKMMWESAYRIYWIRKDMHNLCNWNARLKMQIIRLYILNSTNLV